MARARISEAEAERRAGRALILAVVDAGTDQLLGACDLRIESYGRAEVGYMLGADARGRGAMTKAVAPALGLGVYAARYQLRSDTCSPREPCLDRRSRAGGVSEGTAPAWLPREEGPT